MNAWTMSDWMMLRPVLTVALVLVVAVAASVAIAIHKQWTAWRARRVPRASMANTLPNISATPELRRQGRLSIREAANDGRPRAA